MVLKQRLKNIDIMFLIFSGIIWIKNMSFLKIMVDMNDHKPTVADLGLILPKSIMFFIIIIMLVSIFMVVYFKHEVIEKNVKYFIVCAFILFFIGAMYFYTSHLKLYMIIYMSFAMLVMSIALYFRGRNRIKVYIIIDMVVSLLIFLNLIYYRAYGNFISIQYLIHPQALNPNRRNLVCYIKKYDFIYFFDVLLSGIIMVKCKIIYKDKFQNMRKNIIVGTLACMMSCGLIYGLHYILDTKNITHSNVRMFYDDWTLQVPMNNLSTIGYNFYEATKLCTTHKNQKLTKEEINKIDKWYYDNDEKLLDNEYSSVLKGKNLIFIQLESFENFVIQENIDGQEITPNLNKILDNSYYFSNIYEQVIYNSADGDFISNTSLYPYKEQSAYIRYPFNRYKGIASILNDEDYNTIAIRPENGVRWNWRDNYHSYGYNITYDNRDFSVDEVVGNYISDGSIYRQTVEKLKKQQRPFFAHVITLSSHDPFKMQKDRKHLNLNNELETNMMGDYLQMMHYVDEEIGKLIQMLEESKLMEDTVLVIYGDHCGPHRYNQKEIEKMNGLKARWKDSDIRIPLIIYNPSIKGENKQIIGGQVDIMPTILYLLGIDKEKYVNSAMGKNLLNTKRNFTILQANAIQGTSVRIIGNSTESEEKHLKDALEISQHIIRGNYFKNKLP